MDSYEVLKRAVDRVGAKQVASLLSVSTSLVYKWCEAPRSADDEYASGARNPLDRVAALLQATGDDELTEWLCRQSGGFFVRDPDIAETTIDAQFVAHTQRLISDFSELLRVMSDSMADDNRVDHWEASQIRKEWQDLKRYGERLVCACEEGLFDSKRCKERK